MNGYADFKSTPWWDEKQEGYIVPEACCKLKGAVTELNPVDISCPKDPTEDNSYKNNVRNNTLCFITER